MCVFKDLEGYLPGKKLRNIADQNSLHISNKKYLLPWQKFKQLKVHIPAVFRVCIFLHVCIFPPSGQNKQLFQ